jgi:hypothetical protein
MPATHIIDWLVKVKVKVKVKVTLRPTVCLGVKPHRGPRPDFHYYQRVSDLFMWGAVSDERTGVLLRVAADSRQRSHIYSGQNQ